VQAQQAARSRLLRRSFAHQLPDLLQTRLRRPLTRRRVLPTTTYTRSLQRRHQECGFRGGLEPIRLLVLHPFSLHPLPAFPVLSPPVHFLTLSLTHV